MMASEKFLGKYRATVVKNVDPKRLGRLILMVPDVSNIALTSWALPCVPFSGLQTGSLAVPAVGAGVWAEFEQGNPDHPVWVGGFWGETPEVPVLTQTVPPGVSGFVVQTTLQNGIVVSDVPGPTGGIMLKSTTGAAIVVNDTGIYIQNGKGASIVMVGPTTTVNQGALVIT